MFDQAAANGLWFLNGHVTVRVSAADNADRISVLDIRMPCGEAPPRHVHHAEDEVFHVLEGQVRYQVGDRTVLAAAGDILLAPRGIPHGFRVVSPDGARVLVITRGGFEAMVRAAARPAAAAVLPEPVVPTPAMQAELAALCLAQRIELLGPPIRY